MVRQARSTHYYRSVKDLQTALRQRMREIAHTRIRYGYRRIHALLRREGWQVSLNRVYRLYADEQLQLRSKCPDGEKWWSRAVSAACLLVRMKCGAWTLSPINWPTARLRVLTVVDVFTREALATEVGQRLRAEDVVAVLNRLVAQRQAPRFLFADNGSEFYGRLLDMWAYHYKVQIDFSRPGQQVGGS